MGVFYIDNRVLTAQARAVKCGFKKFLQKGKTKIYRKFKSIHRIAGSLYKITQWCQVEFRIIYFVICSKGYRKSIHPLVEPLNLLFRQIDDFDRDAGFSDCDGEYIIACNLIVILLTIVQVLPEHRVKTHPGVSFK